MALSHMAHLLVLQSMYMLATVLRTLVQPEDGDPASILLSRLRLLLSNSRWSHASDCVLASACLMLKPCHTVPTYRCP